MVDQIQLGSGTTMDNNGSSTLNLQPPAVPTTGCVPPTDNSTCKTTTPSLLPTNVTKPTNGTGNATGVDANSILAVYNHEHTAAGVPPYVWSDTLAVHAKIWVDYLAAGKAGGKVVHCGQVPRVSTNQRMPFPRV